jgi:hypothetical protein
MRKISAGLALLACISLTGCSSFEGVAGKKVVTFDDDYGRACTAVKWGDSASIDCDYKPVGQ